MFELVDNKYIDYNKNEEITDIYEASILYFFEGKTPFLCFDTEGFSGMKNVKANQKHSRQIRLSTSLFRYRLKMMFLYSASHI